MNAAKAAGVRHLVVLSLPTADIVSTTFGAQFHPVEVATKASGLPWTLILLPLFFDNNWWV